MNLAEQNHLLGQAIPLHQQGRLSEAEAAYRRVLSVNARHPAALHLLGVIAHQVGQHAMAVQLIRAALEVDPAEAGAWNNCGEALRAMGNPTDAAACYREALARAPTTGSFWNNLGNALAALEQAAEAEKAYRRAIEIQPTDAKAWYNLGALFRKIGRFPEAETSLRRALELMPNMAEAWNALGAASRGQLRMADAETCYRNALKLQPNLAEGWANLGACLKDVGRLTEAEACYQKSWQLNPRMGETCSGYGSILREAGRGAEACEWYERARQLDPKNPRFLSNLLFTRHAVATAPNAENFGLAREWGNAALHPPLAKPFRGKSTQSRPLRIGYLSADFRHHAVANFVEPLLASHDPSRVEIHCFSSVASPDVRTAKLRARCSHWHEIYSLSDRDVAQRVFDEKIDVLVDLGGHTRASRLAVLGFKPAPVQATYLGYFASTGLDSVDYWISDTTLHPPDTQELTTEKIWRLPRCWIAYGPPEKLPEIGAPAAGLMFGSFNHLAKIGPATLDLWSAVLRALPTTRMLLKTRHLGESGTGERLLGEFNRRGVSRERLVLEGHTVGGDEHLARYNQVDICLDPYPFSGGTTTADALLMGVPLLTRTGQTMPSRMSASMLTSLGLTDWICTSDSNFVELAIVRAREWESLGPDARIQRRREIRARMLSSPLCNGSDLARALEDAYAGMIESASREGK